MYVTSALSGHVTNNVSKNLKSSDSSSSQAPSRPQGAFSPGPGGRYRSRKPAKTCVVEVGPDACLPPMGRSQRGGRGQGMARAGPGFFPPVKLREVGYTDGKRRQGDMRTPPFMLELAPEEEAMWGIDPTVRGASAKSSVARTDPASSCHSRQYALSFTPPVYPHVSHDVECDDITSMPRPRMMVSRGELPWVFRQKVKRNMNELSKIMASRPPQAMDPSGSFAYRYDL